MAWISSTAEERKPCCPSAGAEHSAAAAAAAAAAQSFHGTEQRGVTHPSMAEEAKTKNT